MYVQPADRLPPGRDAGVGDELLVAGIRRNVLLLGNAERMRAGGGHQQAVRDRGLGGGGPQLGERGEGLLRRVADTGRNLDHRREQLHLEHAGERAALGPVDESLHLGREGIALGVEDQQLLLEAQRPGAAFSEFLLDQSA